MVEKVAKIMGTCCMKAHRFPYFLEICGHFITYSGRFMSKKLIFRKMRYTVIRKWGLLYPGINVHTHQEGEFHET